ncbi:MAG: 3'-5' exonuclease [Bacillota bacterium]|nr:3'-5' exonuclease [Bacillota bacterium]
MNKFIGNLTKSFTLKLSSQEIYSKLIPSEDLIRSLVRKAANTTFTNGLITNNKFLVFDTETTGFRADLGDEIISISGVVLEAGEITAMVFDALVNPYRSIPRRITNLTGITNEMVASKPNILDALDQFLSFAHDTILVAHHAAFDLSFINHKLQKYCSTELHIPVIDTCSLAKALIPFLPRYDLDSLITYFDLTSSGRHTSLGDSIITAKVLKNLIDIANSKGLFNLSDLIALQTDKKSISL